MGRISDAFKRKSGNPAPLAGAGVAASSSLEQYVREPGGGVEPAQAFTRPGRSTARREPARAAEDPAPGAPHTPGAQAPGAEPDADRLVDVEQIANYIGFVLRAVVRRRALAGATFAAMALAATAAALLWPKAYVVDAKLLVQRNDVMASLVNPGRTIAREAESPTRAAEEIVLQHDNLLSLIRQSDLVNEWERTRSPLLKLKDRAFGIFRGPMTDELRLDAMVGLLEERLKITAGTEGTVTFDLRWPDGKMAQQLVDLAIQNFLQVRKLGETSAIADSIAILDRSVQTLEAQVNQTISELPRRRVPGPATRRAASPAPAPVPPPAVIVAAPQAPSPEVTARLAKLKTALDGRQQEVARLEELRRQQLSEVRSRLAAATTVYTEGHPTIVALRQSVAQLSRESPELTAVRRDAQNLEAEYDALTAALQSDSQRAQEATRAAQAAATSSVPAPPRPEPTVPPGLDYATLMGGGEANDPTSLRLKVELAELATVRERANAARAELSSSQAGFKYQYSIIRPPQVPRRPSSPNVPAVIAAGVVAALLLAVMAAVALDLSSGRILEAWQVERQIGVPVALRLPKP